MSAIITVTIFVVINGVITFIVLFYSYFFLFSFGEINYSVPKNDNIW